MITDITASSEQGSKGKNRIEQLSDAAEIVQGFAYDLAVHLDPFITTELMLASRRVERLAEQLAKDPRVINALGHVDDTEIPTEG